ncbi:glycosyltransferase [Gammaproteobacteria bacterium]|nr:glycosyltransferase [Gammaproteobacteria bacterium]
MNPEISIVVPTLDNYQDLCYLIKSINHQTLLPKEIVISDSSSSNLIEDSIAKIASEVPIVYLRVGRAYRFDRLLNLLFSLKFFWRFSPKLPPGRAFPYEATNAGVKKASFEWIAFLDATTIPRKSWLKDYWNFLCVHKCDVVFGNTKYFANTKFQKILRASTYGKKGHETAPGSIIKKIDFLDGHEIMEGVRSGGDVAWKIKIKSNFKYFSPSEYYLKYSSLPKTILPTLRKFFIYQVYGSIVDIQHSVKSVYLGLTLMLSLIIVPKWNYIVGWDSAFFIPHITKVFFICFLLICTITLLINIAFFRRFSRNSFLVNTCKLMIFFTIAYSVFNWNAAVAKWVEDSVWYIPHITKIFIFCVALASFIYRGIYFPLNNKIKFKFLFPFNWILVGILGIILDLVKAPGYLLGGILSSIIVGKSFKKTLQ